MVECGAPRFISEKFKVCIIVGFPLVFPEVLCVNGFCILRIFCNDFVNSNVGFIYCSRIHTLLRQ